MNPRKLLIAFATTLIVCVQAQAADPHAVLARVDGTVMVNHGEQFRTATAGVRLAAGDRVMAMAGSSAILSFGSGCNVSVDANSIATIPEGSPCDGVAMDVQTSSPMFAQAVGAPPEEPQSRRRLLWWIFGGAAVGYLIYDQVIRDDDDDPPPVSP